MKKTKSNKVVGAKATKATGSTKGMSGVEKGVLVGVGIAALAASVAGTFYLYGSKNAVKHRKQVKGWMLKAKGEIMEQIENLPEVTEDIYMATVKKVMGRYKKFKNIEASEIKDLGDELGSHWEIIKKKLKIK